jgi:cytochrome c peroxidase
MKRTLGWLGLVAIGLNAACGEIADPPVPPDPPTQQTLDQQLRATLRQWFVVPIGEMPQQNAALVALGQALMFDKELSGNRDVSCITCHQPSLTTADGQSLSIGTGGEGIAPARTLGDGREFVPRNAPTLVNVGLGFVYTFWDGRVNRIGGPQPGIGPVGPIGPGFGPNNGEFNSPAGVKLPRGLGDLLAAQAMFPVTNRTEMRGNPGDVDRNGAPNELAQYADTQFTEIWAAVMRRLVAIPEYVSMFRAAFPNLPASALGFQHAAQAIAAFEKQAFTKTNSRFDRYLASDDAALTTEEKRGALFFFGEARCVSCHNGPFLGGNAFANAGVPQLGPGSGKSAPLDQGIGEIIAQAFFRFAFRVPPLRNVELSAPYMHNGAYATLENVVDHYSDVQTSLLNYDVSQLAPELRATHHGDAATTSAVLANLDFRVQRTVRFTDEQQQNLVAFLKSLTDPAARDLSGIVPARVPSGLPVN